MSEFKATHRMKARGWAKLVCKTSDLEVRLHEYRGDYYYATDDMWESDKITVLTQMFYHWPARIHG